ncbi:hypothetical protein P3T76_006331 [Phytophthora citrophthora]|uniref:Uncharacterized protein n=1 Tax=Phytophthora citrophthora TaxID=4793 RepID=A0AAD9LPD8_9STRA|nr:hypothetical protein P3T76_006331 [Phytophthora citrophthora]
MDLNKEPTKDDLWKLLDRRAAGVLPLEHSGAALLIPIFHPNDGDAHPVGSVSFILVHAENRADGDYRFPDSALRELSPSYVFKETDDPSSLHTTSDNEMIRLFLSLLEVANETTIPAQCIVTEKMTTDKVAPEFNGSLCVRGVLTPNSDEGDKMHQRWPFLTKGLVGEIANTAWDGKAQVENDLKRRSDHEKETRQSFSPVLSKDIAMEKNISHSEFRLKVITKKEKMRR